MNDVPSPPRSASVLDSISEKEVKLRSEESLLPTHAFRANLDKTFSDLETCRSRMAAQQAVEIAIAMAEMAAPERAFRAVVELIIDAAMVRAVRTPGKVLEAAMIAKPRRQEIRSLPVHPMQESVRLCG